jgi:hypothetical protein
MAHDGRYKTKTRRPTRSKTNSRTFVESL